MKKEDKNKYYVHDWRSPICSLFYDYEFTDKHEVMVNVSVYKGRAVLNAILVDGVEIEEFLKTKG